MLDDKIITTFETTLIWYEPADNCPKKECYILIKFKEANNLSTYYFCNTKKTGLWIKYSKSARSYFNFLEIDKWAFLPEFEEFE